MKKSYVKSTMVFLLSFLLLFSQINLVTAETSSETIALSFKPYASLLDPVRPILYLTSSEENLLYAVNLQTKEIKTLLFTLKPESLAYDQNQLFVSFSTNQQSGPKGRIAVIDTEVLEQVDELDIADDPFGIAVIDGYVYISIDSSSYGYSKGVTSYSLTTKEKLADSSNGGTSNLTVNPQLSRFYSDVNGGAVHPGAVDVAKGRLVGSFMGTEVSYPYQNYDFNGEVHVPLFWSFVNRIRVSPDGQYVFDNSGRIMDANLNLVTKLGYWFNDVAFNPENNNFYVAQGNTVKAYGKDYQKQTGLMFFVNYNKQTTTGNIKALYFQEGRLIAQTQKANGQNQLELLSIPTPYITTPEYNDYEYIPLGFTPTDILYDPNQPLIYLTNKEARKLYSVNYETHEIKSLSFPSQPEKLAFAQNKIYVTLLDFPHYWNQAAPPPGKVAIINVDSFLVEDEVLLETDPLDIAADNDGYIYIIDQTVQGTHISSYSEITKQRVATYDKDYGFYSLGYNPYTNQLYANARQGGTNVISLDHGQFGAPTFVHGTNLRDVAISPDGLYAFAGGVVRDQSLKEIGTITGMKNVAFDLERGRLYVQTSDNLVDIYDYEALKTQVIKKLGTVTNLDTVRGIVFRNGELISLTQNTDPSSALNEYYVEHLPLLKRADKELEVEAVSPSSSSSNQPISAPILVAFNQVIFPGSGINQVQLKSGGTVIPIETEISDFALVVKPQNDLSYDMSYTLTIPENAVEGYTGTPYSSAYSLTFSTDHEFSRLGGADRYATSAEIAQKGWQQSPVAVLVYGGDFPDALSAAPLAAKYLAPILLTDKDTLSPTADSEINRLGVELVYIVGGTGVVSQQIEDGLKARGIQVIRLSGSSRYETSAAVASYLGRSEQAFVVSGENFPDALSIASYAASQGSPILLTASTDLPEPILKYLKDNGVEKTYIIGGDGVIPFSVSIKLPNPERISGQDRYQTNLEVLRHFGFDYSTTFLANGESFPDALSGSALAGVGQHPVILVSNTMNSDVVSELGYNTDMMKMKYVLGGTGVLPNPLLDRIFKH